MKCALCGGAGKRELMLSAMPYLTESRRCYWCSGTGKDSPVTRHVVNQQAALSKAHAAAKAGDESYSCWLAEAGKIIPVPVHRRNKIIDDYSAAVQNAS